MAASACLGAHILERNYPVASAVFATIRAHLPRLILLAAWVTLILWLTLTPSPPRMTGVLGWDKLQHAGAFAVMALLAGWFFQPLVWHPIQGWCWGGLFAVFFGVFIEVLQGTLTTTRSADWRDLLADLLGAGVVCLAATCWYRLKAER